MDYKTRDLETKICCHSFVHVCGKQNYYNDVCERSQVTKVQLQWIIMRSY